MKMILGFLPFLAFALISAAGYSKLGLFAGTVIAGAGIVRDAVSPGKKPKILEVGTFALFSALAIIAWMVGVNLSVALVRICVDGGLLIIVLITIAIGKPFTLDYARERISPSQWTNASFVETNKVISGVWGTAFAVVVAADMAFWRHAIPVHSIAIIIGGALYAAYRFTNWYPRHKREQAVSQR
jgi:hypothetical protein